MEAKIGQRLPIRKLEDMTVDGERRHTADQERNDKILDKRYERHVTREQAISIVAGAYAYQHRGDYESAVLSADVQAKSCDSISLRSLYGAASEMGISFESFERAVKSSMINDLIELDEVVNSGIKISPWSLGELYFFGLEKSLDDYIKKNMLDAECINECEQHLYSKHKNFYLIKRIPHRTIFGRQTTKKVKSKIARLDMGYGEDFIAPKIEIFSPVFIQACEGTIKKLDERLKCKTKLTYCGYVRM